MERERERETGHKGLIWRERERKGDGTQRVNMERERERETYVSARACVCERDFGSSCVSYLTQCLSIE